MTLAFVSADAIEQYPIGGVEVRRKFPNTSFPKDIESADLSAFGVATVYNTDQPAIDENTQSIKEGTPALINGIWKQVWNVISLTTEELESIAELKASNIRGERDDKLAASDWTQMSDNPMSNAKKAKWATYRQELRDITSSDGFPDTVVWPSEPA